MNNKIFYNKPFEYFLQKMENNEHFRYSRFNDGELTAIIGQTPNKANCDGHQYFPDMGKELKDVLLHYKFNDNYVLESYDHWYNVLPHIATILHELHEENPELRFLQTDFIRDAHKKQPEGFIKMLEVLTTKKIVLVGPSYLKKLDKHFDFRFIDVPRKNCYRVKNRIIEDMKQISEHEDDVFFLLSASMPANIIIDRFCDGRNTYLDWGSVWDTFFVSPEFSFIRQRSGASKLAANNLYKNYLL